MIKIINCCPAIHQRARAIAEAEAAAEAEEDQGNEDEDELVYPPDAQSGEADDDADEALFSATFASKLTFFSSLELEANLYIQVLCVRMTKMRIVTLVLMVVILMLTLMNLETRVTLLVMGTTLISLEWTSTSPVIMYVSFFFIFFHFLFTPLTIFV